MDRKNKWTYELYNEDIWSSGEDFDTKEEAIETGVKEAKDIMEVEQFDSYYFWVGQIQEYVPCINAYSVLDNLAENACEQCGEVAEDYLYPVSKEEIHKLEDMLNEALKKWMKETNNEPTFYSIINVEKINVR
jgi:hypothetical protein